MDVVMNLEEIEAKADELLTAVLREDHASRAEHTARKLRCLELTARIKVTVAFRKEQALPDLTMPGLVSDGRCPATEFNQGQVRRCLSVAGHKPGGAHVWSVWMVAAPVEDDEAEPTKPVADRLHELVSYFRSQTPDGPAEYPSDGPDAYDDAATKLQEILQEGGI